MEIKDLVKHYLNLDIADVTNDEIIDSIVTSAKIFVSDYIQYPLSPTNIQYTFYGNNKDYIVLKHSNLNSFTSLVEIEDTVETDISDKIDYVDLGAGIVILKPNECFHSTKKYKATYNCGFVELPEDLKYAVVMVALSINAQIENTKSGVSRMVTPDGTFSYNFELLNPAIKTILDSYKVKNA